MLSTNNFFIHSMINIYNDTRTCGTPQAAEAQSARTRVGGANDGAAGATTAHDAVSDGEAAQRGMDVSAGGGAGRGGEGEGDSGTSAAAGGVEAPVQVGVGAESNGEGGGGARRQVSEDASASAVGGETLVRQEAEAEAADVRMTLSAALHRCADVAKCVCLACGVELVVNDPLLLLT